MNLKEFEKTKDRIIQRGRKSTIVLKARIEKRQKAYPFYQGKTNPFSVLQKFRSLCTKAA